MPLNKNYSFFTFVSLFFFVKSFQPDSKSTSATASAMEDVATEESSDQFIEITVSEPHKVGEGIGSYIAYKWVLHDKLKSTTLNCVLFPRFFFCRVSTRTSILAFKKKQFSALRRFSDFLGLHDLLVEKYLRRGRIIPPAPQKNLIGEFNQTHSFASTSFVKWKFFRRLNESQNE